MPDSKRRLNAMLFNNETTNKTDFRGTDIKSLIYTKYTPKKSVAMVRPPPLKDVHTLSNWKDAAIPFSLLHKPKDIIRTTPTYVQGSCEKIIDTGLADAIRTRPRVVITPAVSVDDIEDHVRALLLDNMYTSGTTKAQREIQKPYFSVKAPIPNVPARARPVTLPKLQPPLVSREWRMESVDWDSKQMRTHCDPTKEFWMRRDPPQYVYPLNQNAESVMKGLRSINLGSFNRIARLTKDGRLWIK